MTSAPDFIYLASQSPRRRQLLEQLGVRHELLLAGPEEDAEALRGTTDASQRERERVSAREWRNCQSSTITLDQLQKRH